MDLTLFLQPLHKKASDIVKRFANTQPLTSKQKHYLDWHQKQLSCEKLDPILKYYLEDRQKLYPKHHGIFLLPHEKMNFSAIQQFKKRLQLFLQNDATRVEVALTAEQFEDFQNIADNELHELIFWHGNQLLTGAPFFPGGITPVLFFQWGNLFGVIKYVIQTGERVYKTNILISFEVLGERPLNECVDNYQKELKAKIAMQNKHLADKVIWQPTEMDLVDKQRYKLSPQPHFLIHGR